MNRGDVPGEFRVIRCDMPAFIGDYRCMDYGDPNSERMVTLREEFGLEEVLAGAESQFEGFLALKRWVRSRWNHGYSRFSTEVKDGLDILRLAAQGEQFACGHFARTYVDCARALGWPARVVGISIEHGEFPRDYNVGNTGHSVVEVWSDEFGKWILLDPDVNVYYRRDGVPLSALEIREAWLTHKADEVEMVQDEPLFVVPGERELQDLKREGAYAAWTAETLPRMFERFGRHRVMDYYARVRINGWEWVDEKVLPSFIGHYLPHSVRPSSNPDELYWTLNRVRWQATPSWGEGRAQLAVTLDHCMPYFDHYEVRIDQGEWKPIAAEFVWPMHEGVNRLECRAVNVRGRRGPATWVDVAYASAVEW
ncbi:MAG: transglutaminase-like domain-containing protein [Anaerolineae bacterium]